MHPINGNKRKEMAMTSSQALAVARHVQNANYGSFASALSCAYILADQDNRERLLQAFGDLFARIQGDMLAYQAFEASRGAA